jgi:undecaprenyl-diphosphatase
VSLIEAVVLGAVQGLTEFIPISSSGHLVITPALFGWDHPDLSFDVLLHTASLLALLVYFSGDLVDLTRGFFRGDADARRMVWLLAIGTVPAVIAGVAFGDYFEDAFKDAEAAALQLLITAAILVAAEQSLRWHERRNAETGTPQRRMNDMNTVDATAVGIAQAIAIIPGISRSGATIGAGLGLGIGRDDSARFSFLLAIPALFGASLLEVPELIEGGMGLAAGVGGFAASLVTSYAAIAGLIRYLRTRTLYPFAAYCVVAGIVFYFVV